MISLKGVFRFCPSHSFPASPLPLAALALFLTVSFGLTGGSAFASMAPEPVLNPATYHSPDGRYRFEVNPSDRHGRGEASYRLTLEEEVLWAATLPFTLYKAAVTDDGFAAGYAYSFGLYGMSGEGYRAGAGDFRVVIIDRTGTLILHETIEREWSRFLHTLPNPVGRGLIVDGPNDRLVVRVPDPELNARREWWWNYTLSTGELREKSVLKTLDEARFVSPIDMALVTGTPLILVHYWRYASPDVGARFALIDPDGDEVWSVVFARDYTIPGDVEAERLLGNRIRDQGAIPTTRLPDRFEIFSAARGEAIQFEVRVDPDLPKGWRIEEVSRRPHAIGEEAVAPLPDVPEGELEHLGSFSFEDEVGHPSPVFGVVDFDLDDRDRIGFLRREADGAVTFVLVEEDGRLVAEIPLDLPSTDGLRRVRVAWLSGDDWVVVHSRSGVGERAGAWRLNAANGEKTALQSFDSPAVERIAGFGDGGFLVLARLRTQYSSTDEVARFDRNGRALWRITDNDSRNPGALFAPSDLAVTADGSVALLSNIRPGIKFFDGEGTYLRTIDLEEAWGRRPNYPVGISVEPAGEIFVYDFNGTPPVVRMNVEGEILSQFIPRFPDGRSFDPRPGIKVGPSGAVWAGEMDTLIRLSADGEPEHVLGPVPGEVRMGRVEAIAVDDNGRLYALEARSGMVQVYDDSGNWIEAHAPDLPEDAISLELAVMPDGTVSVGDGDRFALPSGGLLVVGFRSAHLLNSELTVERAIERRPDGNWLSGWGDGAVAPDGSFVLATRDDRANTGQWQINLYRPNGDPVRTIPISIGTSHSNFWYNGRNFVTQADSHLWLFDPEGRVVRKFPLLKDEFHSGYWEAFTTRGGTELWLVSRRNKLVHRFAFPTAQNDE